MARYGRLLTDAQWEKIAPLLPKPPNTQGRSSWIANRRSTGRHSVDSAQRGSLARSAGEISARLDLLAEAAGLGGAGGLARTSGERF